MIWNTDHLNTRRVELTMVSWCRVCSPSRCLFSSRMMRIWLDVSDSSLVISCSSSVSDKQTGVVLRHHKLGHLVGSRERQRQHLVGAVRLVDEAQRVRAVQPGVEAKGSGRLLVHLVQAGAVGVGDGQVDGAVVGNHLEPHLHAVAMRQLLGEALCAVLGQLQDPGSLVSGRTCQHGGDC